MLMYLANILYLSFFPFVIAENLSAVSLLHEVNALGWCSNS